MRSMLVLILVVFLAAPASTPTPPHLGAAFATRVKTDIQTLDTALNAYVLQNGTGFPGSLNVLIVPDAAGERMLDMVDIPLDPWKRRYIYEPPRQGRSYRIYTLGADGKPGGWGKDRDIDQDMIKRGQV